MGASKHKMTIAELTQAIQTQASHDNSATSCAIVPIMAVARIGASSMGKTNLSVENFVSYHPENNRQGGTKAGGH
jgi:hypothetical protein